MTMRLHCHCSHSSWHAPAPRSAIILTVADHRDRQNAQQEAKLPNSHVGISDDGADHRSVLERGRSSSLVMTCFRPAPPPAMVARRKPSRERERMSSWAEPSDLDRGKNEDLCGPKCPGVAITQERHRARCR
jgi:hypothetical protein